MPQPFFPLEVVSQKAPPSRVPKCESCKLYEGCLSPKMPTSGLGGKKVLIIAEAPGAEEDKKGIQLVGNTGQLLTGKLRLFGVEMRKDCWLDNALRCRPPDNKIPDRKAGKMIAWCRPNVVNTVLDNKPEVIIPLGTRACESLLGWLWRDKVGGINRWAGYRIPHQKLNAWVCPTFHPAHLFYSKTPMADRLFTRHLSEACKLIGTRPWSKVPDYPSQVEVIFKPSEAARRLRHYTKGTITFDYETNMLKPDSKKAEIVCCSVCRSYKGKRETISFPWHGPVLDEMARILRDPTIPKRGTNINFEHGWTKVKLGVKVRGWQHDTMLSAHASDNAEKKQGRDITSLKFQAFVLLGVEEWDSHVTPYLKLPEKKQGGNVENRIRQLDLQTLLKYCGCDSLYEDMVSEIQMEKTGYGNLERRSGR